MRKTLSGQESDSVAAKRAAGQEGWEEVADYALNWAVEHAATFTHA